MTDDPGTTKKRPLTLRPTASSSKVKQALPGLTSTLAYTWVYLSVIVLVPIAALFLKASGATWERVVDIATAPRTLAALRLSLGAALIAAFINAALGSVVAWVLARYRFFGRTFADALVDLPFALPTAVAGVSLAFVYSSHGWIGAYLSRFGIKVAFTPLGIVTALTFVGLPFVVRTVQPVIQELDIQLEEAAHSLGATPGQTFTKVLFPQIFPAIVTGFTLAFARAIGEYGSVLFIAGNMPMRTEILPLLIVSKLEQFDYEGAAVLAVLMLVASLALLLIAQVLERRAWARVTGGEP